MRKDSILKTKSFDFALRILKLYKYLRKTFGEHELSRQILSPVISVGAIVREAGRVQSGKEFLHKLNIGLKEINENIYWLDLLFAADFINKRMYDSLKTDCEPLLKMRIAGIKTTKAKSNVLN